MQTPLLHSRLLAACSLSRFGQPRGRGLFRFLVGLMLLSSGLTVQAQNGAVGINTDGSQADGSALLDVKSTTQGVLVPRMTAQQRGLIGSPPRACSFIRPTVRQDSISTTVPPGPR